MTDRTRLGLKISAGVFLFFTVDGLLFFGYQYFDELTRGEDTLWMEPFIEEMTGSYGTALLFLGLIVLVHRFRIRRSNWVRRAPMFLAAMVAFSVVHTTLNALGRSLLFPVAGMGRYDYGIMALRFPMEFFNDILWFWTYVALLQLFFHYREARERELQTARLESELARAQLENLKAQIHPHFLFNTLNTISSRMFEDPESADRMMARLADLLRATLSSSDAQEVPLQEELEVLRMYLEIIEGRFERQLEVSVDVQQGCEDALVPSMILQPLAENAVRHGVSKGPGVGRIGVSVLRQGDTLRLRVEDNGPGITGGLGGEGESGLGIRNIVERLRRLYGSAHRFELMNREEGGVAVMVTIPLRTQESPRKRDGGEEGDG